MENETYYIAKLVVNEEFHSSEIFESLESARLWGMREAKLSVSDSALNRLDVTSGDVRVEIDKHFFGYEISSEELMNHSERVV